MFYNHTEQLLKWQCIKWKVLNISIMWWTCRKMNYNTVLNSTMMHHTIQPMILQENGQIKDMYMKKQQHNKGVHKPIIGN